MSDPRLEWLCLATAPLYRILKYNCILPMQNFSLMIWGPSTLIWSWSLHSCQAMSMSLGMLHLSVTPTSINKLNFCNFTQPNYLETILPKWFSRVLIQPKMRVQILRSQLSALKYSSIIITQMIWRYWNCHENPFHNTRNTKWSPTCPKSLNELQVQNETF